MKMNQWRRTILTSVAVAIAVFGGVAVVDGVNRPTIDVPSSSNGDRVESSDAQSPSQASFLGRSAAEPSRSVMEEIAKATVPESVLEASVPAVVSELLVVKKPVTAEAMASTGARFGMGPATSVGDSGFSDGVWHLVFPNPEDASCVRVESREFVDGSYDAPAFKGQAIRLPDPKAAAEIALEFARNSGAPANVRVCEVYEKGSLTITKMGTPDQVILTSIGVRLTTATSDEPMIVGPGAKHEVVLGEDGRILSYVEYVQQTVPGKEVALRPVASAISDLRAAKGMPPGFSLDEFVGLAVESVSVAYYAESQRLSPHVYYPVYVFDVCNAAGRHGNWVVPAVEGKELLARF